jgi:4-amino-4-deoxy-L-arabinose transferase-like glycosyltransferase
MATMTVPPAAPPRAGRSGRGFRWGLAMALVLAASSSATILAMRRTSTTFDEIVLIAGGARGFRTGDFGLAPDHPPLMQYLYGLPVYLSQPRYPAEQPGQWGSLTRYNYARSFFWRQGNDPERMAFLSRLVAAALAAGLVLLTWAFTRRAFGPAPAFVAGTLVAFLPDVLAHGGVAYNDVPMALAFLATLWAVDQATRRPTAARGALAGVLAALALGVKYSAVLIAPVALLFLGAEAIARGGDRVWRRSLGIAVAASLVGMYLALVAIYRGDFLLQALRFGIGQQLVHVDAPGGAPNYLLGRFDPGGRWYFFPVAFLYKTSAALHLLILCAAIGFSGAWSARRLADSGDGRAGGTRGALRTLLASPLRVPVLGGVVFGVALLASHLDIGFRYALPALPLLCILTAAGLVRFWRTVPRPAARGALAALLAWYVAAPLTVYPWFLSYMSEYGPGRDSAYEVLVDSSIDWGQGLLALRDFMRENRIANVYLSYFGSARPEGYGVVYTALPSFFPLVPMSVPGPPPHWLVVSGTNLEPVYVNLPAAPALRRVRPDTVLGGSLYVYRIP